MFDLQDRLTEQIVGSIEPSVRRAEIERARRKRPDSLDAYDLYLRAMPHAHANTPVETDKALQLLARSIELQPDYVAAHGYAAWCYEQRYLRNGLDPADKVAALNHADIALGINSDDPQAMSIGAFVRAARPNPDHPNLDAKVAALQVPQCKARGRSKRLGSVAKLEMRS